MVQYVLHPILIKSDKSHEHSDIDFLVSQCPPCISSKLHRVAVLACTQNNLGHNSLL